MNYISVDILKKYDCCEEQVSLFKELFPTGIVEFNSLREAQLLAKKYSDKFSFGHLGEEVFGATYEEAKKPHWDTYIEAIRPHIDAYKEAKKPHYDAYQEAIKPHWDDARSGKVNCIYYKEAEKPHLDAYKEAEKPHWDTYKEAKKPHWDAYKITISQLFAELWWELKE